jgi:hypothetical protein
VCRRLRPFLIWLENRNCEGRAVRRSGNARARPMPIAFCWFGSYRWFPSIRRLQSSGRRQSSAGIARGWGIFPVRQSRWQAENLGQLRKLIGEMSRANHLSGAPTHSSCGVCAPGHSGQADCTPTPWQNPTVAERAESRVASALGRGCGPWAIALVPDRRLGVRPVPSPGPLVGVQTARVMMRIPIPLASWPSHTWRSCLR